MQGADELTYWLFLGAGLVFLVGCLAVTWWGLFGDRARGRRRCPRCWYDLSHTGGLQCTECGSTQDAEKNLHRTRRRLLPATLAAVVAASGVSWAIENSHQRGWLTYVPTRVLLASLPITSADQSMVASEIEYRSGRPGLSSAHWKILANRCLKGDPWARPVTPRWQLKYDRLLGLAVRNVDDPAALKVAMRRLPPWVTIESQQSWPVDAPVCLDLNLRHWWPNGTECLIKLTPRWAEGGPPIEITRRNPRRSVPHPLVIDPPSDGSSTVVFDTEIRRRLPRAAGWELVSSQVIEVPLRLEGRVAEVMTANVDEGLEEAIRRVFDAALVMWPGGGPSPVRVNFDPRPTWTSSFDDTAIGARVEIRRDGRLARRLDLWWHAGDHERGLHPWRHRVEFEDIPLLKEVAEDGTWEMTVHGVPHLAVRAGPAASYWAGTIRVPIVILPGNNGPVAPPKDWTEVRLD